VNPRYPVVAARAGHRCEYCRAPEAVFNFPFEVEHIVPAGQSGADTEDNWALACRSCNLFKADFLEGADPETREMALLFHPRRSDWSGNFEIDATAGTILGLTPTGRATIERLRMNTPSQIQARRQWTRLGLFP
jgi:hypothetical protein